MRAQRLDEADIDEALRALAGWSRDCDVLVRSVECRDWRAGVALLDAVAEEADRRNHHPDIARIDELVTGGT